MIEKWYVWGKKESPQGALKVMFGDGDVFRVDDKGIGHMKNMNSRSFNIDAYTLGEKVKSKRGEK